MTCTSIMRNRKHTMSTSLPMASFCSRSLFFFHPQWPSAGPGHRRGGWGRGRRELRQKMETRWAEVKGGVGGAEGQRVDVAAQGQDPENNNRVLLPVLLQVGDRLPFFFFLENSGLCCLTAVTSLAPPWFHFSLPSP